MGLVLALCCTVHERETYLDRVVKADLAYVSDR
jgi:hypothetical protein